MSEEAVDFDVLFPDFDPSRFQEEYPAKQDFPGTSWEVALRRVYDHALYKMAREPACPPELRQLARQAWAAIERDSVDMFVCALARHLLDLSLGQNGGVALSSLRISFYLNVMLWLGFREPGKSPWVRYVLHEVLDRLDLEIPTLSVEQAFLAGYAAGLVDGEFRNHP